MKTIEEKAKAYDEALKRAKQKIDAGFLTEDDLSYIFPQLCESESERIIKTLQEYVKNRNWPLNGPTQDKMLAWLEKQKYDRMKPIYDARESFESALEKAWNDYHNGYENVDKLEDDYVECAHAKGFREGYLFGIEKQKEHKQNATEDMPYIADEHFYEREPADSFKYRLAEYMTKNCKKGEGPYGYSYNISSESILQMAKEELIKRGELKEPKPVELSEEDKMILDNVSYILIGLNYRQIAKDYKRAVEKLIYARPSWKPSQEQMNALEITPRYFPQGCPAQVALISLYKQLNEQLKKLQSTAL